MNPNNSSNPYILLTFDIEDWFQVENFKKYILFSSWPSCELRVEQNTHRILNLLDSHSAQRTAFSAQRIKDNGQQTTDNRPENKPSLRQRRIGRDHFHLESDPDKNKSKKSSRSCLTTPKATFFVLGWIAQRIPHLVKEIHSRGHEVASHGTQHTLCTDCSLEDLKADLLESKKRLEDTIGSPVYGYRAPSFSINDDILKVIEDCGYLYDSSFNSFAMHGRYGRLDLSRNTARGIAIQMADPQTPNAEPRTLNPKPLPREMHGSAREAYFTGAEPRTFYELPISNLPLFLFPTLGNLGILAHFRHFCLPWGGGGYFRLIPFPLFKIGVKFILGQQNAYLFYFHPWEIDPDQPRVNDAPFFYKFRHYINLNKTHSKLSKFIKNFAHCNFITCHQYLKTADS